MDLKNYLDPYIIWHMRFCKPNPGEKVFPEKCKYAINRETIKTSGEIGR